MRTERAAKRLEEREERRAAFDKAKRERAEQARLEKERKASLKAEKERLRAERLERERAARTDTQTEEAPPQPEEDDGNEYASINEILYRKAVEEGRIPPRDDSEDYVLSERKGRRRKAGLFGSRHQKRKAKDSFDLVLPDEREPEDRA